MIHYQIKIVEFSIKIINWKKTDFKWNSNEFEWIISSNKWLDNTLDSNGRRKRHVAGLGSLRRQWSTIMQQQQQQQRRASRRHYYGMQRLWHDAAARLGSVAGVALRPLLRMQRRVQRQRRTEIDALPAGTAQLVATGTRTARSQRQSSALT